MFDPSPRSDRAPRPAPGETSAEPQAAPEPLLSGQWVRCGRLGLEGEVRSISGRLCRLRVDGIEWLVPLRDVTPAPPPDPSVRPAPAPFGVQEFGGRAARVDLHQAGSAREGRAMAERALNRAIMDPACDRLEIIYGGGCGVMQAVVHELIEHYQASILGAFESTRCNVVTLRLR